MGEFYDTLARAYLHPGEALDAASGIARATVPGYAEIADTLGEVASAPTKFSDAIAKVKESEKQAKANALSGDNNATQRYTPKDFQTQPSDVTDADLEFERRQLAEGGAPGTALLKVGGKSYDYSGGKGNYFGGSEGFKKVADAAPKTPSFKTNAFGKTFTGHPGAGVSAMPGSEDFQRAELAKDLPVDVANAENQARLGYAGLPLPERLKFEASLKQSETLPGATMAAATSLPETRPEFIKHYVEATKAGFAQAKTPPPADALILQKANDAYEKRVMEVAAAINRGRPQDSLQ